MVCTSVRKFGPALMGLFDLFKHIYLILPFTSRNKYGTRNTSVYTHVLIYYTTLTKY